MSQSKTRPPTVLVADAKPLSLLATAGVLHHESMRCVCAGSFESIRNALQLGISAARIDASHDEPIIRTESADQVTPSDGTEKWDSTQAIDLIVWDVGDEPMDALLLLAEIRSTPRYRDLPTILIAESKWAGLEKKTEAMPTATHCLFKPIGTQSLITIAQQLLWMPSLQSAHRTRGTRPQRMGWVTLD